MIVPFVSFISKEFERVNFEFSHHVTKRNLFFWVSKVSEYWKEYKFSIRKKEKETMSNPWNHLTEFRSSKKTQQPRTIPLSSFRAPFPPIPTLFQAAYKQAERLFWESTRPRLPNYTVKRPWFMRAFYNRDSRCREPRQTRHRRSTTAGTSKRQRGLVALGRLPDFTAGLNCEHYHPLERITASQTTLGVYELLPV